MMYKSQFKKKMALKTFNGPGSYLQYMCLCVCVCVCVCGVCVCVCVCVCGVCVCVVCVVCVVCEKKYFFIFQIFIFM